MTPNTGSGDRRDDGRVRIRSRKWDGSPHRDNLATELGNDEHGRWLWMQDGEPVLSGDELWCASGGLRLFPPDDAWWSAFFVPRRTPTSRPQQEYVDITTPAAHGPHLIEFVDLDLDVERLDDREVQVLDRDEFDERRVHLGYPEPVVEQALRTAAAIEAMMNGRQGPFDGVWRRWHEAALRSPG
ncbi:DUF402 domain-containing protein [Nakamurella sp. A5-74]|uniref:DUF402 domain-containing protein n=1 Tax=Nakamurella sp. A5-74 TaxID=3158264 RepID=A0AAU8DNS7_9ACTN